MPPSLLGRVSQEDDLTIPEVKSQPPAGVVADVLISLIAVTLLAFFISMTTFAPLYFPTIMPSSDYW